MRWMANRTRVCLLFNDVLATVLINCSTCYYSLLIYPKLIPLWGGVVVWGESSVLGKTGNYSGRRAKLVEQDSLESLVQLYWAG
jgi:hypothetical protein